MGRVSVVAAAAQAAAKQAPLNVWWALLIGLLGSTVVAGLITTAISGLRAAAATRRDGYAQAVKTLIARTEYPYRVRRRVSDDPEVLAALAGRGNDLQEQLAACRTWVNSESRAIGRIYEHTLAGIDATVNPATADAWNQAPVTTAQGMNLAGWGPGDQWSHIARLEKALSFRFGWRRLLPAWSWRWRFSEDPPGRLRGLLGTRPHRTRPNPAPSQSETPSS